MYFNKPMLRRLRQPQMYNFTTWIKEQRISSWSEINIEVFRTETGTRKALLLTMVTLND